MIADFRSRRKQLEHDPKRLGIRATVLLGGLLVLPLLRSNSDQPKLAAHLTIEHRLQASLIEVGNITVEIRPPAGAITKQYSKVDDRVIVTSGATQVAIDGHHLFLNDESYGTIEDHAFVLVDGGVVYVDNVERKPAGSLVPKTNG